MDQSAEGQQVQRPTLRDIQTMLHNNVGAIACTEAARFVPSKINDAVGASRGRWFAGLAASCRGEDAVKDRTKRLARMLLLRHGGNTGEPAYIHPGSARRHVQ
jgi:hypothetical protein